MSDKKEFDNTNRGALFVNRDKRNANHPDYKGSINANGVEYWASAWIKPGRNGNEYLSLAVTPKDTNQATQRAVSSDAANFLSSRKAAQTNAPQADAPTYDDDAPF